MEVQVGQRCPASASQQQHAAVTPFVVFIRGPSGAGKSTISHLLAQRLRSSGVSLCLFEQDYFRNVIPLMHDRASTSQLASDLLLGAGKAALANKLCVIFEGILNADRYTALFNALQPFAPRILFVYLDVSLEETKRRHALRSKSAEFGSEKLDEWWAHASPTGFPNELRFASSSLPPEQVVETVFKACLASPSSATPVAPAAAAASVPFFARLLSFSPLLNGILGFCGMAPLLFLTYSSAAVEASGVALNFASLAATAVLVYAAPASPLAQPLNVLLGHAVSAVIGVAARLVIADAGFPGSQPLAAALAFAFSVWAMSALGVIHPPGGATALYAVTGGASVFKMGWFYILYILVGAAFLTFVAIVGSFFPGRPPYPTSRGFKR